jgi:outer membrane scaffolding protein for murein synthesis (MipA/OmpV family)
MMYKWSLFTCAILVAASPAAAQLGNDRNALTIGIGAGAIPSYEGSNDYRLIPAPVLRGRVAGFGFNTVRTHLYVDAWRDGAGKVDFQIGPVIGVNPNRTGQIGDRRVEALGELDLAIEAGGYVGVTKTGLATPFDSLSLTLSYQKDISDTHDSHVIRPQIAYIRPLNLKTALRVTAGGEIVGSGYARTYFGIDAAGAAASGLARYQLDGGLKDVNIGVGVSHALTGTLLKGWSVFGQASYARVLGDFADSPVVRVAGNPNTFAAALGIAYSF